MEETLQRVKNPAAVEMVQLTFGCPFRFDTVTKGVSEIHANSERV
jgi:hypothetical protein